jgi:tRNA(Ile)-lysidine synthetase-like protein
LHVDHALHPDSGSQAERSRELAKALGVPFEAHMLRPADYEQHRGVGTEEAARRLRYLAMQETASKHGADLVALAHHRDDQAETLLLHLLRGAGLHGAAAMSQRSMIRVPWWPAASREETHSLELWRPFLDEPRGELLGYVAQRQLTPLTDPTNDSPRFRRNRIRSDVLPLLELISPGSSAALARFAELAAPEDAYLDSLTAEALTRVRKKPNELTRRLLLAEPSVLQRRVIRSWLDELAIADLSLDRIEAIIRTAERYRESARIEISFNSVVVVDYDNIYICQGDRQGEPPPQAENDVQ